MSFDQEFDFGIFNVYAHFQETVMFKTFQKWGHSDAIRRVNLKHKTLAERLHDYRGKIRGREWNTGKATGKEVC